MAVTSSLSLWVYTFSVSQIVKLVNCDIKSVDKSPLIDCCHVNWLPFCECHLWQRKTFSVTKSFNLWLWKVWTRQNDRNIIHQRPTQKRVIFLEGQVPGFAALHAWKEIFQVYDSEFLGSQHQFWFCAQAELTFPVSHSPFSSSMVLWGVRITVSWDLFEVVSSSSKERETVPQDGLNDLRATLFSGQRSVAEVAVDEDVNNLVHGGEQLVDWGLNSYFVDS